MDNSRLDKTKKLVGRGNRGHLEIIYSILSGCAEGAVKTRVMFKCNLNSRQVQQYLAYLVDRGLLEKERKAYSSKTSYRTSERGRRYILAYDEAVEMLREEKDVLSPSFVE